MAKKKVKEKAPPTEAEKMVEALPNLQVTIGGSVERCKDVSEVAAHIERVLSTARTVTLTVRRVR